MTWMILILLSAVTLGIYDVCRKHAVDANAVMPVLFLATGTGTVLVVLTLLAGGQLLPALDVNGPTWVLLALKAVLVTASWMSAYYGMRALPISIAAPIRGSQPVWTLIGALVIFGERPTPGQWVGIGTTFAGYYLLSMLGKREGIHFRKHYGVGLMLLAAILGGASGLYDKYLLQPRHLTPETVQAWYQIDLSVLIGLLLLAQRRIGLARTAFRWRWTIPAVGLMLVLSDYCYFSALHQPEALISIPTPIRRSNCVISFLVGGALFRDRNRRGKAVALALVVLGVVILCLNGK